MRFNNYLKKFPETFLKKFQGKKPIKTTELRVLLNNDLHHFFLIF